MGRRPQPEIGARIVAACTDFVLEAGLPDGLRPLADAAGCSPRMLVYHFGGKDELLRQVLLEARRRQLAVFGAALAPDGGPYVPRLASAWRVLSGPHGAPYLGLFGRIHAGGPGAALLDGFPEAATTDWLAMLTDGLRGAGPQAATVATAVLAVVRGLIMDKDATGDHGRADAAFDAFLRMLAASHPRL